MTNIRLKVRLLLSVCMAVFFIWILLHIVLAPKYVPHNNTQLIIAFAAIGLIYLAVRADMHKFIDSIRINNYKSYIIPLFFGIAFIIQIGIAYFLSVNPLEVGWDARMIYHSAVELAAGGPLSSEESYYYGVYPFNLLSVYTLAFWFKLFALFNIHHTIFLTMLLSVICMNVAFVFTYLFGRRVLPKRATALLLLLGFIFITLSLWSRTYYTDTVGVIFPVIILYVLYKYKIAIISRSKSKIYTLALALGVAVSLGVYMKKYTVIIIIATLLAGVIYHHRLILKYIQTYPKSILIFLAGVAVPVLFISYTHNNVRPAINFQAAMPETHFVMMGLSELCKNGVKTEQFNECSYGSWNQRDFSISSKYYPDMDEYRYAAGQEAIGRFKAYGVGGYLNFVTNKASWILGDGIFYAYSEGMEANAALRKGESLVSFFMHPSGGGYPVFIQTIQLFWTIILLLVACSLLISVVRKPSSIEFVLQLAVIGVIGMSVLLEGRSRYLFTYLPIFILLACFGMLRLRYYMIAMSKKRELV